MHTVHVDQLLLTAILFHDVQVKLVCSCKEHLYLIDKFLQKWDTF